MKRLFARLGWSSSLPLALLLVPVIAILIAAEVDAQCGSSASSCKNCHEVNAKAPVNTVGDWHVSHAFGDFCEFCHAGNVQAPDEATAHEGMIAPLSDPKGSCQSCHADDYMEKAAVYAKVLNVELVTSGSASTTSEPAATVVPASAGSAPTALPPTSVPVEVRAAISNQSGGEIVVDDPNMVDYVLRYHEIVLGERPVNQGNVILVALIALVLVGGGGFVAYNELRLRLAASGTKKVAGEYPADVIDMLPAIAELKTETRRSLRSILSQPKKTDKVLSAVDKLVSDDDAKE